MHNSSKLGRVRRNDRVSAALRAFDGGNVDDVLMVGAPDELTDCPRLLFVKRLNVKAVGQTGSG